MREGQEKVEHTAIRIYIYTVLLTYSDVRYTAYAYHDEFKDKAYREMRILHVVIKFQHLFHTLHQIDYTSRYVISEHGYGMNNYTDMAK